MASQELLAEGPVALARPRGDAFRRGVDVAGAVLLLAAAAPLVALAGLLIKLQDGGPVLFRQVRCGRGGRRFTLLKLRTMVEGADGQKQALLHRNELRGPVFKIRHDPRVTRVGRLLRRFSVDELPQLVNVIVGDMALVGPRPPLPEEVERYEPWHLRRLSVKPGLTCLWQVKGWTAVSFDEGVRLDLDYIDRRSLRLDLAILLRTVPAVLTGRGSR
jgi:lipopolysaccharide/colanic/teichoic acid biosynthesis glycosyltransferase